jgi:chromosomal replication initiator protein
MIDDVQFIAGKPTIQEEFFHTFNAISGAGGQIVMTSDRPPGEISKLEERLRSRFGAGLIVDIGPADFELRTAILLIKAKQRGYELPMDAAQKIAANVEGVRELQGILIKLETETRLKDIPIDTEIVQRILGLERKGNNVAKIITPNEVFSLVGNYYDVGVQLLKGEKRTKMIAWPRQILMYILRQELKLPLDEVGRLVGGRDHTTVMHATNKVSIALEADMKFKNEFMEIKKRLYAVESG